MVVTENPSTWDAAAGDWVLFTNATLGTGVYAWARITAVDAVAPYGLTIELSGTTSSGGTWTAASSNPYDASTHFYLVKRFLPVDPFPVSWCVFRDKLWITDGTTLQVMSYSGANLVKDPIKTTDDAGAGLAFLGCRVIAAHADRLWFGYIDGFALNLSGSSRDSNRRNRIVFSYVPNCAILNSGATYLGTSYIDLYKTAGSVTAFGSVDNLLLVFTEDMVYYGSRTSIPQLPYLMEELSTGSMSMIGPRAWCPFPNGIVFATHDDLLFVNVSGQIQRMECPIRRELLDLRRVGAPLKTRLVYHSLWSTLLVAVAWDNAVLTRIGTFNIRSQAWSILHDDRSFSALCLGKGSSPLRWNEAIAGSAATTDGHWDTAHGVWSDYSSDYTERDIYLVHLGGNIFYARGEDCDRDIANTAVGIPIRLETGDLDFGQDNWDKTLLKTTVRIRDDITEFARTTPVNFAFSASMDRSRTWKNLGTIAVEVGTDEDEVHGKATGPNIRIRLTSSDIVYSYLVEELGFKVRIRGPEENRDH